MNQHQVCDSHFFTLGRVMLAAQSLRCDVDSLDLVKGRRIARDFHEAKEQRVSFGRSPFIRVALTGSKMGFHVHPQICFWGISGQNPSTIMIIELPLKHYSGNPTS